MIHHLGLSNNNTSVEILDFFYIFTVPSFLDLSFIEDIYIDIYTIWYNMYYKYIVISFISLIFIHFIFVICFLTNICQYRYLVTT